MNRIIGTKSLRPWLGQRRRSFKVADLPKDPPWLIPTNIAEYLVDQTFLLYSVKFTSKSHFLSKSDFLHPFLTIHPNDECLLCLLQVFPCPLVSPYCQNFQPSIKLWPTILNRNQSWNGFRVKLFLSYFTPRGQFRRPNVECGSKSAIIGENLWKYSWSHQELPSHSPLIPLYSLSRETRFSLRGGTIKPPPHASHIRDGGDDDNINNIMITSIKLWVFK